MTIHMRDVSWFADGRRILDNITWDVGPSEHWAVIGLNGSGKTSLLNMISGYIWPSEGEVTVLGKRFGDCDIRELRKSIGLVSSSLQERFYFGETSLEIVLSGRSATIGLYDDPGPEDIEAARSLLGRMGCGHLSDHEYGSLSQGERQKVLIARALICRPKILVLDEPCIGLDFFSRESFLAEIERIGTGPDTPALLYVSHHIEEITPVFSHVLLLQEGKVYAAGRRERLLTSGILSGFFGARVRAHSKNGRTWLMLD